MPDRIDAPAKDQPTTERDLVRQWLDAIELSGENGEEKDWFATAERACDAYRGGTAKSSSSADVNLNTFNLFHANIETLVPALYNSTPIPDVRRRFNDPDPVGKEVSELHERSISYMIDAYDFDQTMLAAVRDMGITSRGIIRVRYEPTFDSEDKLVEYEQATCEYVPWKTFRRGPGKSWRDVPWIAFELYLSYSEVEKLLSDEKDKATILKEMRFTYTAEPKKTAEQRGENLSNLAARARIWEIWDKDNRQVLFISPDYATRRLTTLDDPLGLTNFYPIPRPLAAIQAPDSLVPITLLQVYEKLLEELNIVQRRIMRLTQQLRVRGWYAGLNDTDVKAGAEGDDGDMIPLSGVEAMMTNGGKISDLLDYWPIEPIAKALQGLVEQRELIKQTIYEVTGLSDIVRGASDARETATAQQLKSQWGSLRIQRMQAEVSRFARDLFRLKAEIMAKKFSFDTVLKMASLSYPTMQEKQQAQAHLQMMQQAQQPVDPQMAEMVSKPAREEVEKLFRDPSGFRVDIESDSTIRGDIQRGQEQMSLFLQGTAQYAQAIGPLVQEGGMPKDLAIEIYAGFARTFRLGKQAEDALDRLADEARKAADQPQPPSPEQVKAQAEQQKMQAELEFKKQEMAMKMEEKKFDLQMKREEMALKQQELEMKMQFQQAEMQGRMQEQQMMQEGRAAELQMKQQGMAMDLEGKRAEIEHKREMGEHEMGMMARKGEQEMGLAQQKTENEINLKGAERSNEMVLAQQAHEQEMKRAAEQAKVQKAEQPKPEKIDLSPILSAVEKLDKRLDKLESSKPKTSKMVRDKEGRLEAIIQQ